MVVPPVLFGSKASSATGVTYRLPEVLNFHLQYHHGEGSTQATIRSYKVEVGLFIRCLEEQGEFQGTIEDES